AQPGKASPEPRFLSIRARMVLAFTLLFTIVFITLGIAVYNFASQRAIDRLEEDLTVLLRGTTKGIDGDAFRSVARFSTVDENGYPEDPRFWRIVNWISIVKEIDNRAGLYTIARESGDGAFYFVASATARTAPTDPGTARFRQPLEVDPVPDEFAALFDGRSDYWLLLDPYQDEFGSWISGYAAIVDSLGTHVGVIGIDYEAQYFYDVRQQILVGGIPVFLTVYVIFIVAIILLITRFMRPLKTITNAAERIGDGEYDTPLPKTAKTFQSEMDILSDVFGSMVKKLDRRETELRKQVEVLKIEIDQAKASAQVMEIVDTDFFTGLQARARNIRNRRSGEEPSASPAPTQPPLEPRERGE
ncbi:MAG: HAMP domain-containing protein, partial [Chloroflexota bacterium]|nr:HAMP domain-containing protein [Chloroflexota bacterium]